MRKPFIPIQRKRLGEILVHKGLITAEQMAAALRLQKEVSRPLGQILVEKEYLTEVDLRRALAEQLGIPHVWLRKGLVDPRIVKILPREKAEFYQVIPMFCVNNVLTLATADSDAIFVFDEVAKITQMEVQPVVCRANDIMEAINECYQADVNIDEVMDSLADGEIEVIEGLQETQISELADRADGSPVINLTNKVLLKAIQDGASDIHLEPLPGKFRVRIRIDGVLYEMMSQRYDMHPAVVSRLKVMAGLDIAERRKPQDGRIQVQVAGQTIDLRFSSLPSIHGEKVVLRILDRRKVILDIDRLGFQKALLDAFKALLNKPHGLALVCGPTGSGKTTTLYAAITLLNTIEKNIITIEDPVEYQLDGVNQNQTKASIGLDFAKFLKHALRQDPDILLVGEVRDGETAEIAIQASLTGHLVLTTIHTNDSISAITRLIEMGVEPFLISSALIAALAQRLVRNICPACKTGYYPGESVLEELGLNGDKKFRLFRGRGCSACYDSGFKGRTGIHELVEADAALQSLILSRPTVDTLQAYLDDKCHRTLKADGYQKVIDGLTTIEEVRRMAAL